MASDEEGDKVAKDCLFCESTTRGIKSFDAREQMKGAIVDPECEIMIYYIIHIIHIYEKYSMSLNKQHS